MLEPKKIKYRKVHRGHRKGMAKGGTEVNFGSYGMKAMEPGWVTARQIEATRISISRRVRKVGKMWIRIFPDKPITKKPLETRMGKGKGSPEFWVANVRPGRILFEVEGISKELAQEAFRIAGNKLAIKTKFVSRRGLNEDWRFKKDDWKWFEIKVGW